MKKLIGRAFLLFLLMFTASFGLCTSFNAHLIGIEISDCRDKSNDTCVATVFYSEQPPFWDIEESTFVAGPSVKFRGTVSINEESPLYSYSEYLVKKLHENSIKALTFEGTIKCEEIFGQLLRLIVPDKTFYVAGYIANEICFF